MISLKPQLTPKIVKPQFKKKNRIYFFMHHQVNFFLTLLINQLLLFDHKKS